VSGKPQVLAEPPQVAIGRRLAAGTSPR